MGSRKNAEGQARNVPALLWSPMPNHNRLKTMTGDVREKEESAVRKKLGALP